MPRCEEKRGRRHKKKVVLEAERQAKAALDKVEKYAVLATIDKQELTFPLLNIKTPVQEAMNTVNKELAIPIPAFIGQKAWREERTTNINDAIKALVTAINVERDKQNNGIRASVYKTYTYYMQQLNKLIIENKALRNENDTLKVENTEVKQRISQLDENAVRRVTAQKDAVKKELAIPIPALIGQKTWREERTTNINDAIKALVTAINVERDKQNNGIRASVNKTYTYYMQQLNKLIIENKALRNETDTLKAENTEVKQRISQLDENAVRRVIAQKDAVIESLNTQLASKNEDITKLKTDYNTLWEKYKILVLQWNDLTKQPEIIEAVKRVEERKEQETEAKREEQARQERYQGVLDRFISEGNEQLKNFSQSSRIDFDEKEAKAIITFDILFTHTFVICVKISAKKTKFFSLLVGNYSAPL